MQLGRTVCWSKWNMTGDLKTICGHGMVFWKLALSCLWNNYVNLSLLTDSDYKHVTCCCFDYFFQVICWRSGDWICETTSFSWYNIIRGSDTPSLSLKNAIVLSKAASQPFSSIFFHIFDVDFKTFFKKWISLLSWK